MLGKIKKEIENLSDLLKEKTDKKIKINVDFLETNSGRYSLDGKVILNNIKLFINFNIGRHHIFTLFYHIGFMGDEFRINFMGEVKEIVGIDKLNNYLTYIADDKFLKELLNSDFI